MALTIPTNLSKPAALRPKLGSKLRPAIVCSATPNNSDNNNTTSSDLKAFSAALALSSILLSAPLPAVADIAVDKEAGVVAEVLRAGQRPALAIKASVEKTKRRFDNYAKQGLLCGADGLPHLIVSGDQRHWGEFITPGVLFLYIAGWIGWVGRSYLIAIRDEKKPTMKEIIIDVPLASRLLFRGSAGPLLPTESSSTVTSLPRMSSPTHSLLKVPSSLTLTLSISVPFFPFFIRFPFFFLLFSDYIEEARLGCLCAHSVSFVDHVM
ncbi:hypothetical protein ACSQ67_007018 [Phaseolus vulgaris]